MIRRWQTRESFEFRFIGLFTLNPIEFKKSRERILKECCHHLKMPVDYDMIVRYNKDDDKDVGEID